MAFFNDNIFDSGLQYITTYGTDLYLCSGNPTTYAEASSTYAIAVSSGITIGSVADGDSGGRKVVISPISSGTVLFDGTATHYAIVDSVNSGLLVASTLSSSKVLYTIDTFNSDALNVGFDDPT